MQVELMPMDGQEPIEITFTDEPASAFGGLALFVAFTERFGLPRPSDASHPRYPLTCPTASDTVPPPQSTRRRRVCLPH